jgi:hypothetical protein
MIVLPIVIYNKEVNMKLIDKIKNYFYDEEDEIEKSSASDKIEKVVAKHNEEEKIEKNVQPKAENLDAISERELFRSDPTFNFPIIFDDEDFKEEKPSKHSINKPVVEKTSVVEEAEIKTFKPSLNISPVYGIIGDDVKKETTVTNSKSDNLLNLYDDNKKVNIDDVLDKVYSQKRVDLKSENYENKEDAKGIKENKKETLDLDLFDNLDTREEVKKDEDLTDEVDKKLKSIDELLENTDEDDFYSLVDSMYKEDNEEGDK